MTLISQINEQTLEQWMVERVARKLAAQGAEVVRMPGNHTEMLNERSAEFIARHFDQAEVKQAGSSNGRQI